MKMFSFSFTGLVLAATAAHAQPAADVTGAVQGDVSGATEGAQAPAEALPATPGPASPADTAVDSGPEGAVDASVDGSVDAVGSTNTASPAVPVAATAGASASITDAEVDSFAKATVELQKIQNDASIGADQKQTAMAAAVAEAGLDPAKYNEIGAKVSNDAELRTRVQAAMARHAPPSDG